MPPAEEISDQKELASARIKAAELSAGISADPIYGAVLQQVQTSGVSGKVLDYGAGTGNFARRLCGLPQFSRVTGTDLFGYDAHFQDPKLEWIFCDLNQGIVGHDEEFDLIVALEIIEHLENPRFVAREWFRLLKPGGILVFSTPNNESWRAVMSLIFKHHFAAFVGPSYPAHVTALLRMDMERVLTEAGFEQVNFSFSNHGAVPKATHVSWQRLSRGTLRGLRYSDNIVCYAKKPPRPI